MSGAMTRFTLRSLTANRVRTLVTVAGVALAAALLTAVLTTYTSLQSMLYEAEGHLSGTWMAEASSDDPAQLDAELAEGLASGELAEAAVLQDLGFGQLTEEQRDIHGSYLVLKGFTGDVGKLCAVRPSEGRLPEAPDEILLSGTWHDTGGLEVGDTITLPVGERIARVKPGRDAASIESFSVSVSSSDFSSVDETVIVDGTKLDSSHGYLGDMGDGSFEEELVNVEERTFTVTGFYDRSTYVSSNGAGMTGFVGGLAGDGVASAYVTLPDVDSTKEVEERAKAVFPEADVSLHLAMLRYMGVRSDGAVWETFFAIAAVLAVVIAVSCVSLIYNAFAISVAERMRQFGLLASIGASKRQLRRAVLLEAGGVALAGIPLGLVVGIAGCTVTFALIGPMIAQVFGAAEVGFPVKVAPWALVASALFTLVTVLVSAAVPAVRASRVNVVDALRGAQVDRASKRGAARAARAVVPSRLWAGRGLAGRVFGMGGQLARLNGKRGASRGRAASVSLALAIVLLMTAGSLSAFLGTLADVAGGGEAPADIAVMTTLRVFDGEDGGGGAGDAGSAGAGEEGAAAAAFDEPMTAAEAVRLSDERFIDQAAVFGQAWEVLCATPDAEPVGWQLGGYASIILPDAMAGKAYRVPANGGVGGQLADGRYAANALITYLDDASFDRLAAEHGLDAADYHDAAHPRAIGVAKGYGNDGTVYQLMDVLRSTGTVEVLAGGALRGVPVDGFSIAPVGSGRGGDENLVRLDPFFLRDDGREDVGEEELASSQVEMALEPLEVAALIDEAPPVAGRTGEQLQLIVPMSLAQSRGYGIFAPTFTAYFNAPEGQSPVVAQELVDRAGAFFHDETPYETSWLGMSDYASSATSNQMLALVVNVFCLLFSVILALIALANVFNTVTNGLILRRREFAVMRSTGLSNRQFRAMIMDECVAWCLRGLVPGILVSVGVSFLLYRAVSLSISGLAFVLPWGYVALAFAMTAVAIGVSVAYGMRRCKADSVVEALRMDNA